MFADGLQRHFRLGTGIDRMFPRLNELWQLHAAFLGRLRSRQRERPAVISLSDILLDQFSGTNAERLKSAYGICFSFKILISFDRSSEMITFFCFI